MRDRTIRPTVSSRYVASPTLAGYEVYDSRTGHPLTAGDLSYPLARGEAERLNQADAAGLGALDRAMEG